MSEPVCTNTVCSQDGLKHGSGGFAGLLGDGSCGLILLLWLWYTCCGFASFNHAVLVAVSGFWVGSSSCSGPQLNLAATATTACLFQNCDSILQLQYLLGKTCVLCWLALQQCCCCHDSDLITAIQQSWQIPIAADENFLVLQLSPAVQTQCSQSMSDLARYCQPSIAEPRVL